MVDISVIIPVFNMASYLDRCLDSVLGQTIRNLEVLCIDDGSTDESRDILLRRAEADPRLKLVFMPENGGPSAARNAGLDVAKGRYIGFLDSDDWIDPNHFEVFFNRAEETGRPFVINASYIQEYDDPEKKKYSTWFGFLHDEPGEYDTKTVQLLFPPVLWARLYRRDFLEENKIRFPNLRSGGEDNYFTCLAEIPVEKSYVFRGPYYHYYQRDDSLMHQRSAGFDYILAFKTLYDELQARNLPTEDLRLFYAGPMVLDSEEKYLFTKHFLEEIKPQVLRHSEWYIALDLHLMEAVTTSSGYADFLSRHNPVISIDFIRYRLRSGQPVK